MNKIKIRKKIPIVQIGSLIQQNIGESIGRHGYGIYNVYSKEYKYVDLFNPKPYLKFEINSFNDIINGTELLKNS